MVEELTGPEAVGRLVRDDRRDGQQVSAALGKSRSWVSVTKLKGDVMASTLAAVARECGHVLAVVPEGADLPEGSFAIRPAGGRG
jgi:hypothetical protein